MGVKSWILGKVVFYALIFGFFYLIGESLGIVPQALKNFIREAIDFVKANLVLLAFCFCFTVACWTIVKLGTRPSRKSGVQGDES